MPQVLKKFLVEVMLIVHYAVLKIVTFCPHISLFCQQRNIFVNKMAMVMISYQISLSSSDNVDQQYTSSPDVVVDYSCGLRVVAPTSLATSAMSLSAGGHRGYHGEDNDGHRGRLGHISEDDNSHAHAQWSSSYWSRCKWS